MLRFLSLSLMVLVACQPAPVGVRNTTVSADSGGQCVSLCNQIGMPLDAVVIMADNVGCVCRAALPPPTALPPSAAPASPPPTTSSTGGSSAGGMAALLMQQQQQQAAAQHRRKY